MTIADSGSRVGLAAVRGTLVATISQVTGQTSHGASSRTGNHASGHQPGTLLESALMSPYVFVDRSASRASGLWMVFGASSTRTSASVLPDAQWTWAHLAAEFVREHGGWRIRHLRLVPRFRTSYTRSWVETARSASAPRPGTRWSAPLRTTRRFRSRSGSSRTTKTYPQNSRTRSGG